MQSTGRSDDALMRPHLLRQLLSAVCERNTTQCLLLLGQKTRASGPGHEKLAAPTFLGTSLVAMYYMTQYTI